MREVVQKVYKFEELERKVQEEVLERYRYVWVDSLDWGEYTEEDFTYNVFSDHGFEVDKDGVSFSLGYMEEDEKYAYFIDALEEWRKEECERLYENAEADYEYYTCDNYIRTELAEGNYEFLADGTDF